MISSGFKVFNIASKRYTREKSSILLQSFSSVSDKRGVSKSSNSYKKVDNYNSKPSYAKYDNNRKSKYNSNEGKSYVNDASFDSITDGIKSEKGRSQKREKEKHVPIYGLYDGDHIYGTQPVYAALQSGIVYILYYYILQCYIVICSVAR
jgi:hypothetical protein